MQRTSIAVVIFAVLVASAAPAVPAEPRPDAKPSPPPASPAASSTDAQFCPLNPTVTDVDGTKTRYAVVLHTLDTGLASGIVSLYAGSHRYDVRFDKLVVPGVADQKTPAPLIVVRFPAAVTVDGAAVTAIDDNGLAPCNPVYTPWVAGKADAAGPDTERLRARARAQAPVDASAAVDDPISCAEPYRPARTTFPFRPDNPYPGAQGTAKILVLLGPDNRILATRVVKSAGNQMMDRAAADAAGRSHFEGVVFRCHHVFGNYLFSVDFNS